MELTEAKNIVGKMVLWHMKSQGITPDETTDPITEDLKTLIEANEVVDANNKAQLNDKSQTSHKVCLVLDDRAIAALYVAANFYGDSASDCNILAMHNDNVVLCLHKSEIED